MKVRRDDQVKIISGKDRGKTGRVIKVDREKERVYVEDLNIIKRHQRPAAPCRSRAGSSRRRARSTSPTCSCSTPTASPSRVGMRRDEGGRRVRVAKRSGKDID